MDWLGFAGVWELRFQTGSRCPRLPVGIFVVFLWIDLGTLFIGMGRIGEGVGVHGVMGREIECCETDYAQPVGWRSRGIEKDRF